MFVLLLTLLGVLSARQNAIAAKIGDPCKTPNGTDGMCGFIKDCTTIKWESGFTILSCGTVDSQPLICCTGEISNTETTNATAPRAIGSIAKKKCEDYSRHAIGKECYAESLVFRKKRSILANSQEFPHMVQIGFGPANDTTWQCAGILISENYVLTAAHCLYQRLVGKAEYIRAGISNLSDTTNVQQRNVKEIVLHPRYVMRGRYHDIGLVKVDKAFELNAWIRPACLHTEKQLPDTSLYSSGWGVTEFLGDRNQDLLKSKLEVTLVESCNSTYSREIRRQILKDGIVDEYMVCAESRTSISPCQVDSGGPLQYRFNDTSNLKCMYGTIGVLAFGKGCGISRAPIVYTRISAYVNWIENIVWP